MTWFPQIGQGSTTQFPFHKLRRWRAIRNQMESGEQILFPDAAGGEIDWTFSYKDLSDDEAARLRDLFTTSLGSFGAFALIDPLANLLAWSGDLTQPDWQIAQLTAVKGAADPKGNTEGWSLTNASAAEQQLTQTVSLPGEYVTCFSLWLRADSPCVATLQRDAVQLKVEAGSAWKRYFVGSAGPAGATHASYSLTVPAGQTVQIWCPQVDAQPYPSAFKMSAAPSGIYPETYFAADELTITQTAPLRHACEVKLISRV